MPFDAVGFEIAPAVVTEPWRKVLLDAADYIEAHGWCQHYPVTPDGRVCLMAAISRSQGFFSGPFADNAPAQVVAAADRMVGWFGGDANSRGAPADWNDRVAESAAEVTAALRACARS